MARSHVVLYVSVSLMLAIAGCSADTSVPTPDGGPDTGVPPTDGAVDSGPRDGGPDMGPRPDTGPLPDTGVVVDMGTVDDTGVVVDMGVADDAFVDVDMGVDAFVPPMDMGVDAFVPPVDAFVPPVDAFVPPVDMGVDAFVPPRDMGVDAFVAVDAYAPGCGNRVIDAGEQCDDGNLRNLDGCDSTCHYELITRMTDLQIQGGMAPASCTPRANRLGSAFSSTALGQLNPALRTDVQNGNINVLTQFLGLADPTGASGSGFSIGVMDATLDPAHGAWPMAPASPIDWWFFVNPNAVNTMGLPTGLLTGGSITGAARTLTAGPNTVTLSIALGGSPTSLQLLSARINAVINAPPNMPAPPPSAFAAGFTALQSITASTAGSQGLCGNVTVQSLAQIPIPQALTTGTGACVNATNSHVYTYCGAGNPVGPGCNSLLDVLVGGCKVLGGLITVVTPVQPDVPGGASVITLSSGPSPFKVTVPAGDMDAYSSYFTFTANRAHATGESCTTTAQCQTGQTCTMNVCTPH